MEPLFLFLSLPIFVPHTANFYRLDEDLQMCGGSQRRHATENRSQATIASDQIGLMWSDENRKLQEVANGAVACDRRRKCQLTKNVRTGDEVSESDAG